METCDTCLRFGASSFPVGCYRLCDGVVFALFAIVVTILMRVGRGGGGKSKATFFLVFVHGGDEMLSVATS